MNRNRSTRRLMVAAAASALCVLATALPASAAPTPSPAGPSASIPVAAQVVVVEHSMGAPVQESVSQFLAKAAPGKVSAQAATTLVASAAVTRCWYYNDWRQGKNIFGNVMWQFNVEPNWCGDGSYIRNYAYTNTWGTTSWVGWAYNGVIGTSANRWGVGWNVYEVTRQGSFCYINFYGCVQNQYPYVDVEVGAGGQLYKT